MNDNKLAHHIINIGVHVLILFIFLTIFFFSYISRQEKKKVTKEINSSIKKSIPSLLDNIDHISNEIGYDVDWYAVKKKAIDVKRKVKTKDGKVSENPVIKKHDSKLLKTSIGICIGLFVLIIGSIIYFTFYKRQDIGLKDILIDNLIIALAVGTMEAMFFNKIAMNYSPIVKSDMSNEIVDRLKYNINK